MLKTIYDGIDNLEKAYDAGNRQKVIKLTNRLRTYLDALLENLQLLDSELHAHHIERIDRKIPDYLPIFEKDLGLIFHWTTELFNELNQNNSTLKNSTNDTLMKELLEKHAHFKNTFEDNDDALDNAIKVVRTHIRHLENSLELLDREKAELKDAIKTI
ncbi:MAG: hypothetical protein GXP63_07090 [DPANN group archaeon]|nr:hypothetical protein [DPANN group archaeon]